MRRRFKRLLLQGSAQTQCTRTANTCANLLKLNPALWTFWDDPAVPPTNNESERALIEQVQRLFAGDPSAVLGVIWRGHRSGC